MNWNPLLYLNFSGQRLRPALDLIARMPTGPFLRKVDLGCGAGNVTRLLAQRWPEGSLLGVDSSAAMLAQARENCLDSEWECADIAHWHSAAPLDLLFSNAALHWLDDHANLLPRLLAQLAPGGCLALQMPANFAAPAHAILRELAATPPWRDALAQVRMGRIETPEFYYDILSPAVARLDLWQTVYWQTLHGQDAVLRWMQGTTLIPYLAALTVVATPQAEEFLAVYGAMLARAYPPRRDGSVLFPFQRLFLVAEK
ncbi:MAG TPA: methyltransferase domain-containing protein [Rhodocyclaceae bacterium]|nr:methyltransferase domain-containing protein [Rhodocyclaceae bacterium]